MASKLNALSDNQWASNVRDSAQQIWLAGLGAFARAQEEGNKVFEALVKEGETLQDKTRQAAGDKVTAVANRAVDTWDRLEQVFEDRVARALSTLGVPTKKEIDKLSLRVADLTSAVQQLTDGKAPPKARATAAAKPKAAAAPKATKAPAERKAVARKTSARKSA